jgi:D-Tyr-tRNAtyr deacylase
MGRGMLVLLGGRDGEAQVWALADKIVQFAYPEDDEGKMKCSLEVGGQCGRSQLPLGPMYAGDVLALPMPLHPH